MAEGELAGLQLALEPLRVFVDGSGGEIALAI